METEKEMVRIFVGGLGETVTGDELRRVFELSGGDVESLEFVRSKARSFAYVDFSPSTDKSLPKLFAKYNGCVWKGGKLKLEKAKEHYLKRLEREWAEEDSEAKENSIQLTEAESSEIPKNLAPPEKREIRIFFPRLRKVKLLPFTGTGKHKYSFQRIDVSSPPKYFCDCEEHSGLAETEKRICHVEPEPESDGVNREELDIMNKVMSTLFQKQNCEVIDNDRTSLADDKGDNEADGDDEDDLVINFASKGSDEFALLDWKQLRQVSQNQVKSGTQEQRSKRGRFQEQKLNENEPINRKKKPLSPEQIGGDESAISASHVDLHANSDKPSKDVEDKQVEAETSKLQSNARVSSSQKSSWNKLFGDKDGNIFSIAATEEREPKSDHPDGSATESKKENLEIDILASPEKSEPDAITVPGNDPLNRNLAKESEFECAERKTNVPVESQPAKSNVVSSSPTRRGSSWMQKSSWTQLVGDNGTFSISQPVFSTQQVVSEKPKVQNSLSAINGSKNERDNQASDSPRNDHQTEDVLRHPTKEIEQAAVGDECSKLISEDKHDSPVMEIPPVRVEVSETCTFMRNATSMKEWAKAKAALSGSRKRKSNQK